MTGVRLLVCGGRTFSDAIELDRVLSAIHAKRGIDYLIQGEAPGADTLAKGWAHSRRIPASNEFAANWDMPRAGPTRNQRMLDEGKPTLGVAFPGGNGTLDMRRRCLAAGVPCMFATAHRVIAMGVEVRPLYEWKMM